MFYRVSSRIVILKFICAFVQASDFCRAHITYLCSFHSVFHLMAIISSWGTKSTCMAVIIKNVPHMSHYVLWIWLRQWQRKDLWFSCILTHYRTLLCWALCHEYVQSEGSFMNFNQIHNLALLSSGKEPLVKLNRKQQENLSSWRKWDLGYPACIQPVVPEVSWQVFSHEDVQL